MSEPTFDSPGGALSNIPSWFKVALGIMATSTVALGGAAMFMGGDKSDGRAMVEVPTDALPSDFFSFDTRKEEPEPEPIHVPEIVEPPKPVIIYRDRPAPEPKKVDPPVSADRLFVSKPVSNPTDELREQILQQRRSQSKAFFSVNQEKTESAYVDVLVSKNNDRNWDAYGQPSVIASYPVDLQRVVTNDSYIRCTTIDAILSEMEDRVTCVVTHNIYGSHGRKVLIPAGSKAKGFHGTIEAVGNTRVAVVWEEITTPDGVKIRFKDPISSSDSVGRAGVPGEIDRRYDEKYGAALLISAFSVITNVETAKSLGVGVEVDDLTNSLDEISKQIVTENADIKPVLLAGQGQTILLKPTTDIWFQEPCGEEVVAVKKEDAHKEQREYCNA